MRKPKRKLSLQLTPLLDMLLTVIFLQFLTVRQREVQHIESAQVAEELAVAVTEENSFIQDENRLLRERYRELQATVVNLETRNEKLESFVRSEESRGRVEEEKELLLAEVASDLFHLTPEEVDRVLKPAEASPIADTPEKRAAIRQQLRQMAEATPGEVVQHLLTYGEIRKRCDVWELHIDAQSVAQLRTEDRKPKLRVAMGEDNDAEVARFATELEALYRDLPQSKALVIILLTYERGTRLTVSEGVAQALPMIVDRLRSASGGLSRFEFADLGVRVDTSAQPMGE